MRAQPNALLARIERYATSAAQHIALTDGSRSLSYTDLLEQIAQRRQRLRTAHARRVALALDNGLEWALWDLALMMEACVAVPIPEFFSDQQRRHIVQQAGLDSWIGHGSDTYGFQPTGDTAITQRWVKQPPVLHAGTTRITFTSGTSGAPKGVCLDNAALLTVTESLATVVAPLDIRRHLALLPLSTLLENISGLYLPLWLGACSVLPGMAALGWQGASGFHAPHALEAIDRYQPNSLIVVPQLLQALVNHAPNAPRSLRFVAVGGATVAPTLLANAQQSGWPVYEGYGLSECTSVVCLNRPGEPSGGVGRPLPHAQVQVDENGQLHVRGALMLGYLGEAPSGEWYATGDTGHWQGDAIRLNGRQREVFITAYGRNVNPQWVEGELCTQPAIAQAMVYGEALPANRALIVPASTHITDTQIDAAIDAVNRTLPDYAQVHAWQRAAPFTPHNQQLTANGRLRRDTLLAAYGHWLQSASHPTTGRSNTMTAYQQLQDATQEARTWLLTTPIVNRALAGNVTLEEYLAFLGQAYHHVRFTVPLMMACGARLPDRLNWLRTALVEYIEEEHGHEQWILDDIRAAGGDADAAAAATPDPATRLMVAWIRDSVEHGNPVAFFGMVQVLEGTSTALATQAAERLQASLSLPNSAVRYLTSHGSLDIGHLAFFEQQINQLGDEDLAVVIDSANMFYRLYGAMFRGIQARSAGRSAVEELSHALA